MLLSWFLYEITLERNKDILKRLQHEIRGNGDELKYEDVLNGFKYLESTLLETLRYHPAVPYLTKYGVKDMDVECEGITYRIHGGSGVTIHCYSYSRMKHIYGDDAEQFNPMRFYEKGINTFSVHQYPYFNVEPRLCLGRKMAILQAKIVAISVIRNFEIHPVEHQKVTSLFSPLYSMKYGFKITVSDVQ